MRNILIGRSSGNYRNDISAAKITATPASVTYTGNPFAPPVMVELDGIVLKPNDDYSVRYVDNVSVGKGMAVVEGKGMYVGTNSCEITILPVAVANTDLSAAVVTVPQKSYTYSGSAITPEVTVKMNGTNIALGTDYSVTYSDNVDIGTAKITITAVAGGTYQGSQTITFSIVRPDLKNATVTLNAYVFSYTGSLVCPVATVKMMVGQTLLTLTKDVDYELSYVNNGQRGTAQAVVSGIGGYAGSKSVDFQIGKDLSAAVVDLLANTYPYTGAAVDPEPVVTLAGSRLTKGVDYTVSYEDNVNVGLGRVIVTGIGDYIGSVTAPLNIDNSENEAWERTVLTSAPGMYIAVRRMNITGTESGIEHWFDETWYDGYDDNDMELGQAAALPDGSFIARVLVNGGDGYSTRLARFGFSAGHPFDISSVNGVPVYFSKTAKAVSPMRSGSNGRCSSNTGYLILNDNTTFGFAHYGRIMFVPKYYGYRVKDTGGYDVRNGVSYYTVSDETDANGSVYKSRYGKYIVLCDLDTPYDIGEYGNERRAYNYTGSSNDISITYAYFNAAGTKFIFHYKRSYKQRIVTLTLKSPFVLNGPASVESTTDVEFTGLNAMGRYLNEGIHGLQFSPDGRHAALALGGNFLKHIVLVHLSSPWDLNSVSTYSSISVPGSYTGLYDTDGTTSVTINGNDCSAFFLFLPQYGKMLVASTNGNVNIGGRWKDRHCILEYTIA